jgi:REP element-mobilizing transposase RayT
MATSQHSQAKEWASYHVTTRVLDQKFHLASPEEKKRIVDALDFRRRQGDCSIYGFVVMDNHLHCILGLSPEHTLSDVVKKIKTWTSRNNQLKPPNTTLWDRRYDDNRIRSTHELRQVIEYIHNNPVRAGMVSSPEEYPWSSVHNYLNNGRQIIEIDTNWWE